MQRWYVTLLLFAVLATPGLAHQNGQKLPVWKSDSAQVGNLGAEFTIQDHGVSPPRGYAMQTKEHATRRIVAWTGKQRSDGTRPGFSIIIVTPHSGPSTDLTMDDALKMFMDETKSDMINWKQSAAEHGRINGSEFVRAYWSGTDKASGAPLRGFYYGSVDAKSYYTLDGQDVGTYAGKTLPLLEAAALTFREHHKAR